MKTTEITEEMINEFRQRVLKRVPKGKVLLATERSLLFLPRLTPKNPK
jgi:hypothetical protein